MAAQSTKTRPQTAGNMDHEDAAALRPAGYEDRILIERSNNTPTNCEGGDRQEASKSKVLDTRSRCDIQSNC